MADKHPPLPSIDDDLGGRPKLRIPETKPRPPVADEAVDANTANLARNWPTVSTSKPTESESKPSAVDPAQPPKPETVFDSIRLNIPAYLNKQLSLDAAEKNCTKTHLILQALANAGYRIDPPDMTPDRRAGKK